MRPNSRDIRPAIESALVLSRDRRMCDAIARGQALLRNCVAADRPLVAGAVAVLEWRAENDAGNLTSGLDDALAGLSLLEGAGFEPALYWIFPTVGLALGMLGDFERGLEYCQRGIERSQRNADRPRLAIALCNRGILHGYSGHLDSAEQNFHEVLAVCGDDPDITAAMALGNLSYCRILRAGRDGTAPAQRDAHLEEALRYAEAAIERVLATPGADPHLAAHARSESLLNRGIALCLLGRFDEAEAVYRSALEIRNLYPQTEIVCLLNYAELLIRTGRREEAVPLIGTASAKARVDLVDRSLDRIFELNIALARDAGRLEEVDALWAERFALARRHYADRLNSVRRHERIFGELQQSKRSELEARAHAEALRESEEKFRLAFSHANAGMALVDQNGGLLQANARLGEMFGYSVEQLGAMDLSALVAPEDLPTYAEYIRRAATAGLEHAAFEGRFLRRGKEIRHALVSLSLARDARDRVAFFIVQLTDITEQKLLAERLQAERLDREREKSRLEERVRLTQDVHDGFGAQLASARMLVEYGELTQGQVAQTLQECIADLHLVVNILGNEHATLGEAFADFRFRTQRRLAVLPLQVSWRVDLDDAPPLPHRTILQVMRIAQEALNNALRHAEARAIEVTAACDAAGRLALRVGDDGKGIPTSLVAGRGIENMRRRAAELGGRIEFQERAPGTVVAFSMGCGGQDDARPQEAPAHGNVPAQ